MNKNELNIDTPSLNIIVGMQGIGKSTLIRFLMYKWRKKFDYGVVFCNTFFDKNNDSFDYMPPEFVHSEYNEAILENLMNIQAKLIEKGIKKNAVVIFDDCLDDPNEFKSVALKKLSTQLRHYNITLIFSTQYSNAIPSRMRANTMNVFIFHTDNKNSLEALYNSYGQQFESYNEFKNYMLTKTGNYKFIFFNKMKSNGKSIEDNFRIYRAPVKIPHFKIKFNTKI